MQQPTPLIHPTREQISTLAALRAVLRRSRPSSATTGERMQAVILADFVAESVAKLAAESLGVRGLAEASLPKVFGDLETALAAAGAPFQRGRIGRLHDVRKLVQHQAVAPSAGDAIAAADDVEDFSDGLCRTVWGISFRELTRTQLIEDARLRRLMEHAAAALERGDTEQVLGALAHAAARLRFLLREDPWRRRRWVFDLPGLFGDAYRLGRVHTELGRFGEDVDQLGDELAAIRAGLVGPDYEWFLRVVPEVQLFVNRNSSISYREPGPSMANLARAHELLTDWVLSSLLQPEPTWPPQRDERPFHRFEMPANWPDEPEKNADTPA